MAVRYNTYIPTDGLEFYVDADNVKSYPGSGSTVTDLSTNKKTAAFVNGATAGTDNGLSYFSFDGVDDYIDFGDLGPFAEITVEVWARYDVVRNYSNILDCNYSTSSGGNAGPRLESNDAGDITWLFGSSLPTNGIYNAIIVKQNMQASNWFHTCFVWSPSTRKTYFNGVESIISNSEQGGNANAWVQDVGDLVIGRGFSPDSATTRGFDGRTGSVKIYRNALTADQVKQNFFAHRSRYGI